MTNLRAWTLEVHNPDVGKESMISCHPDLAAVDAIALMESSPDKAFMLRESGEAPMTDYALLTAFQIRTGKRLQRI